MHKDKYLVIGAGFVGLGLAKALKDYDILYDQAEADNDIGGNWYHGVYPHVHIISSRKTTEYTDFPMPSAYPDFPSAPQILAYLRSYTDHFGLRKNIEFNKTVKYIFPLAEHQWEVTFADSEKRIYKGILACNGHHWNKRFPAYPGSGFTGTLIHSKDYRGEEILKDKKVLVIGAGNSACDIAVDAAKAAREAHISMRRGYWFLPKTMLGIPTVELIRPWLPVWVQRIMLQAIMRIAVGNYQDYGLQKPDHKIFERHPTINSLLLYYLKHGTIKPHPDIKSWNGKTVEFTDGQKADFDLIVAATGFNLSYPFFPENLVKIKNNIPQLPLGLVHPEYKGLFLVGWEQVRYGVGPMITAGAPNICRLIQIQEKMEWPVGAVMLKAGMKIPDTHLVDPMKSLKENKKAKYRINKLPLLEKLFFGKNIYQFPDISQVSKDKTAETEIYF